eukprot:7379532-Prymnesium_polylepis.1
MATRIPAMRPASKDASKDAEELPPGWRAVAGDAGTTYYVNRQTGETSWEKPVLSKEETAKALAASEAKLAALRADAAKTAEAAASAAAPAEAAAAAADKAYQAKFLAGASEGCRARCC